MANSIESLAAYTPNSKNILRVKTGAAFVAPMSVDVPESITVAGTGTPAGPPTLAELTGWKPVGLVTKDDGYTRSRDRNVSALNAVGYQDPVRQDVTQDASSTAIVAMEHNRTTIEQFYGIDLSSVTPDPATGEVKFPHPNDGVLPQFRWLFIFQDGATVADRTWWGYCYPCGSLSDTDDQTGGTDDDSGWYLPLTIGAQVDTTLGYSVYSYFGGAGWQSRLTNMGFGAGA